MNICHLTQAVIHHGEQLNSCTYIVLGTFNGARFLAEQLDSIIAQTDSDWTLFIRDDGSTDATLDIIQGYCKKDHRILSLTEETRQTDAELRSALANFSVLLGFAYEQGVEYLFCCDQDDIWESDKLSIMLARLKRLEGRGKVPSLVHHDLVVANEFLEPLDDSYARLMQLHSSDQHNPQRLLSRNEVTGCALACNRALLQIALPVSDEAIMHDWWLALCAGYFGRLEFCTDKLATYRQHSHNTIGAKSLLHGLNPLTNWYRGWLRGDGEFVRTVRQAEAFLAAMADRLDRSSEAYTTLELYRGLVTATRWQRLKALQRCNVWRSYWLLNIVLVLRMLLLPRTPRQ